VTVRRLNEMEAGVFKLRQREIALSICIVNYNTKQQLRNCIESILACQNKRRLKFEIIVADNGSSDGSAGMVKRFFPRVKLITNQTNTGYARGVNRAMETSRGRFILVLNPDTLILPGAVEKTFRFLLDHEKAGIVGCKILNSDHSLQRSCRSFPSLSTFFYENACLDKLFPASRVFGKPFMSYFSYDRIMPVDVVMGAFMMIRRETIRRTGGFDEYSEETDFCYRTRKAGWDVLFYPGAEIVHLGGGSTKRESARMFLELHKSHCLFIEKYHGALYTSAVKLVLFLGLCIRIEAHLLGLILRVLLSQPVGGSMAALRKFGSGLRWYFGGKGLSFDGETHG
jgi:GT2 family glycosyltransferase